jgi:hypothetical protein
MYPNTAAATSNSHAHVGVLRAAGWPTGSNEGPPVLIA